MRFLFNTFQLVSHNTKSNSTRNLFIFNVYIFKSYKLEPNKDFIRNLEMLGLMVEVLCLCSFVYCILYYYYFA